MILAGDIGGTSTRLALFNIEAEHLHVVRTQTFPSRQFTGLADVVTAFAPARTRQIDSACFGIAGPVQHGRVVTPNLPWVVDSKALAHDLSLTAVTLLNDLEANAYGIAALSPEDFVTLNIGTPAAEGNAAVISVGTGLGEAGLYWDGRSHRPFACEGGHADFAARDAVEAELLLYLRAKAQHVSYERVLSGSGLQSIYAFLRDSGRAKEIPAVAEEMRRADPAAVIANAGLQGRCELCVQALDMFVSAYGAEAGNLALKMMSAGGVFIGGGIAPKIIQKLKGPAFMAAFTAKGRMKPLLEAMPVRVIMQEKTALLGAARYAAQVVSKLYHAT
jgi:glucokinase